MSELEIWLIAVGLAMDCLAVSIASGIILNRYRLKPMLVMALSFGLFQGLMPLVGWLGTYFFSHLISHIDHWIAFGILAFLGGRMISESLKEEEERHDFNPARLQIVLALAVATSIDALAVGISFACLGLDSLPAILYPVAVIGWVSFLCSMIGLVFGIRFGGSIARKLKAELWGGIILVLIGIKILIEHLFFN